MENSYQETLLDGALNRLSVSGQYSRREVISIIRDCFTIERLQREIDGLSASAAFNSAPREGMAERYDQIDKILLKYPNVVKPTIK